MITHRDKIAFYIQDCLCDAYEAKIIPHTKDGNVSIGMLFPFTHDDIMGVYTRRKGIGAGVWFQLRNGKIYNQQGREERGASCTDFDVDITDF